MKDDLWRGLDRMTRAQLAQQCGEAKLRTSGNRSKLLKRLHDHFNKSLSLDAIREHERSAV